MCSAYLKKGFFNCTIFCRRAGWLYPNLTGCTSYFTHYPKLRSCNLVPIQLFFKYALIFFDAKRHFSKVLSVQRKRGSRLSKLSGSPYRSQISFWFPSLEVHLQVFSLSQRRKINTMRLFKNLLLVWPSAAAAPNSWFGSCIMHAIRGAWSSYVSARLSPSQCKAGATAIFTNEEGDL